MKVLIVGFDLYDSIGGGQTFYKALIEKNPNIDFYYLRQYESARTERPKNCKTILYREFTPTHLSPRDLKFRIYDYCQAVNIARSLTGASFDVVDMPDYQAYGCFLREALSHYGVSYQRFALSMHGTVTTSLRMNWQLELPSEAINIRQAHEDLTYRSADIRYAISRSYQDEWSAKIPELPSQYYDPFHFFSPPPPDLSVESSDTLPKLNFIGRTEKRKGPDLFLDLAAWLPQSLFREVQIIGPAWQGKAGHSHPILQSLAQRRGLYAHFCPSMNTDELNALFRTRSITFVPSRYDTLNLVALESLFAGCPTVIGSGAGVCRLLQERFPHIPFVLCNIQEPFACLQDILAVLKDYDIYRNQLVSAIRNSSVKPSSPDIRQIYTTDSAACANARQEASRLFQSIHSRVATSRTKCVQIVTQPAASLIQSRRVMKHLPVAKARALFNKLRHGAYLVLGPIVSHERARLFSMSEMTEREALNKLNKLKEPQNQTLSGRGFLWNEFARLERRCGNDLVAACYDLRVMRMLGCEDRSRLNTVTQTLSKWGYSREAEAADVMFADVPNRELRCYEYLERTRQQNRTNPDREYEFIDDRRTMEIPKVSVIVSLYKAESKLSLFLRTLGQQTLARQGAMEVILIDSGSPTNEYAVFKQIHSSLSFSIVYARSKNRETIQSAWNRGINLARAPYLSFLGADEAIVPNCLEILHQELDADATLDWVQANSLVTNVDEQGAFVSDVMLYDRSGYQQDLVYLETCYLSWVGALYRKSIHDRFGYYDASFTAAGDTEFKGRVLPYIRSKSVPLTLGVFRNFPEERTTQHPRAEIEDLRAWYLHRTAGGARYAFGERETEAIERQLVTSLCYRKSYLSHLSSDIDYALQLGEVLRARSPQSPLLGFLPGAVRLMNIYRKWDFLRPDTSLAGTTMQVVRMLSQIRRIEKEHRQIGPQNWSPIYRYHNDNHLEQHNNVW